MERQLDIFKTKRQKGTVAPGPTEFEIHCFVADILRRWCHPDWEWFHPPNGGEREAKWINGKRVSFEGGRLKRQGTKPGVSDLILYSPPHCTMHVLELKRKGEKPSDEQYDWMQGIVKRGGKAAWADTVEGALDALKGWGAVPQNIHI